jgi:type VI secretion system protein VasJ
MNLDDVKELGSRPIRADSPAGGPARDEPEFEVLQLEIRKLELPDGQQPDWSVVRENASAILGRKSKDLLVAAYLGLGLLQREGYAGLAAGFTILRDMVDAFWESLYPEASRMRGRAAAFDWLAERAGRAIETRPSDYGTAEALGSCRERLGELIEKLESRVPGGFDGVAMLRRTLDEAESRMAAPAPSRPAAAAAATIVAPSALATPEDLARAMQEFRDLGRRIGEYLRSSDPANPLGYRLPRMVSWRHLKEAPASTDGKTQIPAPQPPDLPAKIQEMVAAGQWAGVLEQTESRFATAVLWLDLQRFAATALEGLGHATAAQGVIEETAAFLRRVPGVESLRFAGDQPLADEATRAWLRARTRPPADESSAGGGPDASRPTGPLAAAGAFSAAESADLEDFAKVRAQAQELARQKRLPQALALLEARARGAATLRGRAPWQLETARLCLQAGRPETAYAQLQILDETLGSSRAEDWAPDLCVEVLKNLFLAHRDTVSSVHPRPAEEVERARELRRRLSRLDAAAALSLEDKR